eukprot:gb/GECG01007572.1/.p1 GENE.gb/GECG01007572.1/~~gb/GECG01007572.1/.p1  ORF type:complete len:109 (+),score=12.70 gb/GECG01007572.1/:1-327(+)
MAARQDTADGRYISCELVFVRVNTKEAKYSATKNGAQAAAQRLILQPTNFSLNLSQRKCGKSERYRVPSRIVDSSEISSGKKRDIYYIHPHVVSENLTPSGSQIALPD